MQKRIDIINDPKEVVESLQFENFHIDNLDLQIKRTMDKLEFKLPDKLVVPITLMYIGNAIASRIQVLEKNIVIELDPREMVFMSEKLQKMLSNIKHPV